MCFFPLPCVCVFFFPPLSSFFFREMVGGGVSSGAGCCNRGNRVKPHCYYSSKEVPEAKTPSSLSQNKHLTAPPPEPLIYLPLLFWAGRAGEGRPSQLTLWPPDGRPVSQP